MSYGPVHELPYVYHSTNTSFMVLQANDNYVTVKAADAGDPSSSSSTSVTTVPTNSTTNAHGPRQSTKTAKGSALTAKTARPTNEIVCSVQRPAISALDTPRLKDTCYHCFASPEDVALHGMEYKRSRNNNDQDTAYEDENIKVKLKVCTGCRVVKFCDKTCQQTAWESHHKWECSIYAALQPRVLPNNVRAIVRLLLQKQNNRLPLGLWEDVNKLTSHMDELRQAGGSRWENLVIMAQGTKEYSKTAQEFKIVLELLCILMINSFTLMTSWNDPIGLCLHPLLARINHSCHPNSYIHFPLAKSHHIKVLPLRKIGKNEEITIAYVDTTMSVQRRQEELQQRYFFQCECSTCNKEKLDITSPQLNHVNLSSVETKALQMLESAEKGTSINDRIVKLRYALFTIESSKTWPVQRDPYPLLLHKLILAYIEDHQFNIALAYAAILHFDVDPLVFKKAYHPTRLIHTMLFIRLMTLIISAEEWSIQNLDLRPFKLNLIWSRRYTLRGMQRALAKTALPDLDVAIQREINWTNKVLDPGNAELDKPEDLEKAMAGVRRLTDWAYGKIRKWETD